MGHHHPSALEAQAAGIRYEEAWVSSHAAAVDHLINSREYKLGTLIYAETGHVPRDRFWSGLLRQEEHNPSGFLTNHPLYAGFFTAPAKLGELPMSNIIFDVMKDRDQLNHANFAHYHPFYIQLVDRDLALEKATSPLPVTPIVAGQTGTKGGTTSGTTGGTTSGTTGGAGPGSSPTGGIGLGPPGSLGAGPGAIVPEPASGLMLAAGMVVAMMARRLIGGR